MATVTMDAMDPKSKGLAKLLKKNKVKMEILTMRGPSGWPEVELTGKREDLETVLADGEYGWDDPELAEYIEESADVNEAKITLKRRYTENHPAVTVGKAARIRNKMLEAIADGALTEEEFNNILSEYSANAKQWMKRNARFFNVSEEGIALSKFGKKALSAVVVNEEESVTESEAENILDDLLDERGGDMGELHGMEMEDALDTVEAYGHKGSKAKKIAQELHSLCNESTVTEAKFVKDFNRDVLNAKTKEEVLELYPNAEFFIGKSDHFFGELDGNLFFKAYYTKGQKEFEIKSVYSEKGSNYVHLYNESVVTEAKNDGNLDTIADYVQQVLDDGKSFMDIGKKLKGAYKYDFSTGMMPMYIIPVSGNKIVIINKKYVENGQADRIVGDIAIGLMENIKTEITNMENTFSIHESFESFNGANGFLNEAIGSQLLASVLMSNIEGKYGKQNLKQLAGGFYQLAKVALDKIGDEDMIISNDPTKVFKEHGGSKHILFFISDNEKENPYCPYDAGYGSLKTVPGGGLLIAAMSGDREFYTNDWSRYSRDRAFKKDGKKGKDDQVGVSHKYRGWSGTGLNNGKRIAEVSDRVLVINLDLIRQKYSTEQLRAARKEAKAGAIAFTNDKDFKKANNDRYHQILATKAAKMPLDKMVADAIDMLTDQIKDGLAKGEKTRYEEIKIGENAKGKEVKLRDASNHMSNILDDYSRYCDYVRQEEESEKRFGSSESWYKREVKNYALSIKERIAKIEGFDYAW